MKLCDKRQRWAFLSQRAATHKHTHKQQLAFLECVTSHPEYRHVCVRGRALAKTDNYYAAPACRAAIANSKVLGALRRANLTPAPLLNTYSSGSLCSIKQLVVIYEPDIFASYIF